MERKPISIRTAAQRRAEAAAIIAGIGLMPEARDGGRRDARTTSGRAISKRLRPALCDNQKISRFSDARDRGDVAGAENPG